MRQSQLVTSGYKKWKKATEDFMDHAAAASHRESILSADAFVKSFKTGQLEVVNLIRKHATKEAEQNKRNLISIIKAILFLGRQGIPLRGHLEQGRIITEAPITHNDGNFRAFLRHQAMEYDEELKQHLKNAPLNAQYTSPSIQNEILEICGNEILQSIVSSVNSAQCFSVMADETTDVSTKEQLTICVRYICDEAGKGLILKEDFIGFSLIHDMTGLGISTAILSRLRDVGLDLTYIRGQSYDGASSMCSDFVGVKTRILAQYPLAIYTYCSNHCLNLVVSQACKGKHIRNMIGTIKEITSFFSRSSKRTSELYKKIREKYGETKMQVCLPTYKTSALSLIQNFAAE